jgi:2-polyprenyl-3-methyl-5-hydroxy-6-metoxy-1,4-benzoquinol methylase
MEQANEVRGGDSSPISTIARHDQARGDTSARQVITDLSSSVWAFSALACALEAGLLEALSEAHSRTDLGQRSGIPVRLVEGLLDVLVSLGLLLRTDDGYSSTPELLPLLQAPARDALLADIRSVYLQSRAMIDATRSRTLSVGWSHTDPDLLAAQGASSASLFHTLAQTIFPRLNGLVERLQSPTGTFLDVGTGVGAIAIQMCRLFPHLHVVGLEPQEAPLAEACRNVAAAKLEERIDLRAQGIEDLAERGAFDFVWLPQIFLQRKVLEQGLRRSWTALRPRGWILLITFGTPGMDLDAALLRLTNVSYGGDPLYQEQVAELLAESDFVGTQIFPIPTGSISKLIVGQRPPS